MADADDRTATGNDLYSSLGEPERAYLTREFQLSLRLADSLALLQTTPYPLDAETAEAVAAVVRRCVLPWETIRDSYLMAWVGERLIADGEAGHGPWPGDDPADFFPDPAERREFEEQTDFTCGLTGVRDAEVEEECNSLHRIIEAIASAEKGLTGVALPLALPLGPPSLGLVPVVEGEWVDRHWIALAEWTATLAAAGFGMLPSFDPHQLAWHRVYPPHTNWSTPVEASTEAVEGARREALDNLGRFSGRTRRVDGRPHLRLADYSDWAERRVRGDLVERPVSGLVVTAWNAWIDAHSNGNGRVYLHDEVFGRIHHPIQIEVGSHFDSLSVDDAATAVRRRVAALAEWRTLIDDPEGRVGPEDIFSPCQMKIIQAIGRLEAQGVPATADNLAGEANCDRSRLYQPNGIKELMNRNPPLVFKGPRGAGYRLSRPQP